MANLNLYRSFYDVVRFDLNTSSWKKFKCFKNLITEIDVVNYLLDKDVIFENSYDLYQDIFIPFTT